MTESRKLVPQRVCAIVNPETDSGVNGAPACPVSVLSAGDLVALDEGSVVFHVSVLSDPYVGVPLPEHAGRECPVCLLPLEAGEAVSESVVYVCPSCSVAVHLEARIAASGEVVECARAGSSCPACQSPRVFGASYEYVPEL